MTTETETISQFEVVLMHEIGHAWMAQKLGIEPMFVEMDEDEDEGLGGWTHFGKALQGVTWKQTMLIAMAGMAGEAVVTGEDEYRPHPGALQDIAVATQALQSVVPDATADECNEALEWAFLEALKMMLEAQEQA